MCWQARGHKALRRVQFHYTPKHASWLNMAEIEIGILSRQCLNRRIANQQLLRSEVDAWQQARNALERTIEWKSLDRMQIRNSGAITFRNLRVDV